VCLCVCDGPCKICGSGHQVKVSSVLSCLVREFSLCRKFESSYTASFHDIHTSEETPKRTSNEHQAPQGQGLLLTIDYHSLQLPPLFVVSSPLSRKACNNLS